MIRLFKNRSRFWGAKKGVVNRPGYVSEIITCFGVFVLQLLINMEAINQGIPMSQILICDNCGAKIEIEDSDEVLSISDSTIQNDENFSEVLCENCGQNSKFVSVG